MEPSSTDRSERAIEGILSRAEQSLARAGDRLLVEQIQRLLDEQGSAALGSLTDSLLPLAQALVIVLPQAVTDSVSPAVLSAAQTLGMALRDRGLALSEVVSEGVRAHERLLSETAGDLRANDHALVAALLRISRAILEVESAVLLAFQEQAGAALARAAWSDPATGLASWTFFERRLDDQLQLARRWQRPVSLALLALSAAPATGRRVRRGGERRAAPLLELLRTQIRATDLAARRAEDRFALLLPETGHADAQALLSRLQQSAGAFEAPVRFHTGVAVAPDHGLTAEALFSQAEQELAEEQSEDT